MLKNNVLRNDTSTIFKDNLEEKREIKHPKLGTTFHVEAST